jgi:hypothetical protein
MISFLWFTLKASICLIVFYLFFILFFRKSTFFRLNRIYLVSGLMFSMVIPLLTFTLSGVSVSVVRSTIQLLSDIELEAVYQTVVPNPGFFSFFSFHRILLFIYFSGVFYMFIKLLRFFNGIFKLKLKSSSYSMGRIKIVKTQTVSPFSFFNIIFLPVDETNRMILDHEITHVRQFHWIDLIIAEAVSVILWFNPFVVLYKNSLKLQHEYLADNQVLRHEHRAQDYLMSMLRQVKLVSSGGLASPFYCKTIKKRVIMITKNKTSVKYVWTYLLIVPLVGILLTAFTLKNSPMILVQNKTEAATINKPSIYPVNTKSITQKNGYGERINPMTKKKDFHRGIDLAANEGTNVMATANGVVTEAQFDQEGKMGNYIIIKHDETYTTLYSHLKSFVVKAGDKVQQGQVIGYVGNTGVSTGPHLHYEVIVNGERVNPKDYLPE